MEEKYVNLSRRPQGRRGAPAPRRPEYRDEPPRLGPSRRRDDSWDDWEDEPPRRGGGSLAVSVLMGFYKVLVVISVIIVAVYIGSRFLLKAPEQKQTLTPPNQTGTQTGPGNGAAAGSGGTASDLNRRDGVYNIFLAATDAEGYRTDIMMVMCYDTVKQTVGVVSIPRDTLVARDSGNPHLVYGKGGVEDRIADVSHMLGIPIDGYIKVNIKGFITLVDYLEGVDFYVPCDMDYDDDTPGQDLHIHFKKGMQHLNGQQAMEVARFRKNSSGGGYTDTGRTQTQQALLVALAKKVLSWNNLTRINGFVEIFNDNVDTDLSLNNMLYFASQAVNLDPSSGVETATLEGNGFGLYRGYRYCYELDPDKTLETVNRLINPYDRDLTLKDMNIAKAERYHN